MVEKTFLKVSSHPEEAIASYSTNSIYEQIQTCQSFPAAMGCIISLLLALKLDCLSLQFTEKIGLIDIN